MPELRELAFGRDEFLRHLPYALKGFRHRLEADGSVLAERADGARLLLRAEELAPRRLSALLALPRLSVTLAFEGFDAVERSAFMANFDRAFQRGGG